MIWTTSPPRFPAMACSMKKRDSASSPKTNDGKRGSLNRIPKTKLILWQNAGDKLFSCRFIFENYQEKLCAKNSLTCCTIYFPYFRKRVGVVLLIRRTAIGPASSLFLRTTLFYKRAGLKTAHSFGCQHRLFLGQPSPALRLVST